VLLYLQEGKAQESAVDLRERRRAEDRGIAWKPKSLLAASAEYTTTRAEEISRTLRKLEERGLVQTYGSEPPRRRRTQRVKLTDLGRHEAQGLMDRDEMSAPEFDFELGVDQLKRLRKQAVRRRARARKRLTEASGDDATAARAILEEADAAIALYAAEIERTYSNWMESAEERARLRRFLGDELRRMEERRR